MKTLKKIMIVLGIIAVIHFSATTFLNENRTITREIVGEKFIATHCARHIKQMEEVKADPNFPEE